MNERTQPAGGPIRIGDFVVDPRSGELRGSSGKQLLSGQPLHVLLALAEHPGQVVTRDELRARLWPADTYVDFEHGLNAVVKRLRDALGDSADTPRYIETVPRRGYRLIAEVAPAAAPAAAEAPASPPVDPATSAPRAPRRRVALVAIAVVTAGAVTAFVYGNRLRRVEASPDPPAAPANFSPKRLTFNPGLQTDPTWSPDGRRIAYVADQHGNLDLFTQSLDGGEPMRVTSSSANETQPAWSPDGRRLVFRSDEGGGGLFTVTLETGAVRRITSVGFNPAWMPDGRDVAFAGPEMEGLYLVRADGGEPPREILAGALTGGTWASFAVHPDGRIGVFGVHPELRFGFFVSDLEHRRLRSVTEGTAMPGRMLDGGWRVIWNRKGDAIFIEGVAAGVPAIWWTPVDPVSQRWRQPQRLTTGLAGAERAAISPDGGTLAFANVQSSTRIWVFPFDADRGTPPGAGRPVTDEDATVRALYLGGDGRTVYYQEERPGRDGARSVRADLDTGESTVLFSGANTGLIPAPSGGGSYLLERKPSGSDGKDAEFALVWRDPAGRERLLSTWSTSPVIPTAVRRDEKVVLGTLERRAHSGRAPLVEWPIGPAASASPARVLVEAKDTQFWQGHYSPDGRWVSFVALNLEDGSLEMGLLPAKGHAGSAWTRLAADHPWPDKPRWAPDGRTVYFLSRAASGYLSLWGQRVDPQKGTPSGAAFPVARFDSPRWRIDPDISTSEIGVAKGRLVLPMRSVKGSIWLLKMAGT
jgi:Tol biopolymer transport system component/DNA-binding winged helix-turn-helix (wHTH) protein